MRLGVDFSQYGGALAASTVQCWKGKGVNHAVVQYSERMSQHLEVLTQSGGLELEAYVYLYWGLSPWSQTPRDRVRAALAIARGRISRLWLDAEDTTHPYQESQLAECVAACDAAGMPCGIYTGRWWWVPRTGDSRTFSHLPLWHAEYLGEAPTPDLSRLPQDFSAFRPYGGWSAPAIWQWWNTTSLCAHSVDLNAIPDGSPPIPTPPSQEDEDMQNPVWATWKDLPAGAPYRSYLLYFKADGSFVKQHVRSAEEHMALFRICQADPMELPLEDLKLFEGGPEPDEP